MTFWLLCNNEYVALFCKINHVYNEEQSAMIMVLPRVKQTSSWLFITDTKEIIS